ncbi:MAG: biopolymer transporter ExbD [Planctomycetaceae bacterium]|nr:biopolymer transporter ExbD [Planctomycetaceae bacterium]
MRLAKRSTGIQEGDMTPMIDMVFQLIAFFMVLVNFTEADQNQRIRLPSSELAKPPDAPLDSPITIHLTSKGTAIMGPNEVPIQDLTRLLTVEYQVLVRKSEGLASQATIIIRGDLDAQFGLIQEIMQICQNVGFEKFALRAKQQEALSRGISRT